MKKNDLLSDGTDIIRVLDYSSDKILIIDCRKRQMPHWICSEDIQNFEAAEPNDIMSVTEMNITDYDSLSPAAKKKCHERFTLIAPILPFVANENKRSVQINALAATTGISTQTIRRYLCLYLVYTNIFSVIKYI